MYVKTVCSIIINNNCINYKYYKRIMVFEFCQDRWMKLLEKKNKIYKNMLTIKKNNRKTKRFFSSLRI